MTKKPGPAHVTGGLRNRAEKFLAAEGANLRQMPPGDVLKLVHELQVHQIELEMQNEELRRAQETIAETGHRYADLYDFAPVGYATLDPQGLIVEVNLTGARLLGMPRTHYSGPLSSCLSLPKTARPSGLTSGNCQAMALSSHSNWNLIPNKAPPSRYPWRVWRGSRPGKELPGITWPSPISPGADTLRITCGAVKKSSVCSMKRPLWAINPWMKTALSGRSTRPGWTSWDTPVRR